MDNAGNIARLKDLSELMLELAYSAVFLHEKEFSKQVRVLFEEFKEVYEKAQKELAKTSSHDAPYISRLLIYIKEIATNSVFLSDLSDFEKMPFLIKNALKSSSNRIIEERLGFSSFFAGRTLGELDIKNHSRAKVLAVQRGDKWIFSPGENFRLKAKDLLIAIGDGSAERILHHATGISRLEL